MATPTIARSGQESTDQAIKDRVRRGLKLFRERSDEIEPLGHGRYGVPSCTTDETYEVDLDVFAAEPVETCSCPDFRRHGGELGIDKHIVAASLYRAKTRARMRKASKAKRRRRGELEHIGDVTERVLAGIVGGAS